MIKLSKTTIRKKKCIKTYKTIVETEHQDTLRTALKVIKEIRVKDSFQQEEVQDYTVERIYIS